LLALQRPGELLHNPSPHLKEVKTRAGVNANINVSQKGTGLTKKTPSAKPKAKNTIKHSMPKKIAK